jgi:tetratricopeptide (TPR) repeat protein
MFCSNCGNKVADGSKFCPDCGTKVGQAVNTGKNGDAGYSAAAVAFYERGNQYYKAKDYDNALMAYGKAVKQEPGYWEAYQSRALIYMQNEEYEKAIKNLDRAIKVNKNEAVLYALRGISWSHYNGKPEGDVEDYETVLRRVSGELEEEDDEGCFEEALMDLSAAIKLNPKYVDVYGNRADIYIKQNDYESAIADYTTMIELKPDNASFYRLRGRAYYQDDEEEKAIQDFDKSLEIEPSNIEAYYYRALAHNSHGNTDDAVSDLTSALSLMPNPPLQANLLIKRAAIYKFLERYDEAMNDINEAIAIQPLNTAAFAIRGDLRCLTDQVLEGKEDYDEVLRLNSDFPVSELTYFSQTQIQGYMQAFQNLRAERYRFYTVEVETNGSFGSERKLISEPVNGYGNFSYNSYSDNPKYWEASLTGKPMLFLMKSDADRFCNGVKNNWEYKRLIKNIRSKEVVLSIPPSKGTFYIVNAKLEWGEYLKDVDDEGNLKWSANHGISSARGVVNISEKLGSLEFLLTTYINLVDDLNMYDVYLLIV